MAKKVKSSKKPYFLRNRTTPWKSFENQRPIVTKIFCFTVQFKNGKWSETFFHQKQQKEKKLFRSIRQASFCVDEPLVNGSFCTYVSLSVCPSQFFTNMSNVSLIATLSLRSCFELCYRVEPFLAFSQIERTRQFSGDLMQYKALKIGFSPTGQNPDFCPRG